MIFEISKQGWRKQFYMVRQISQACTTLNFQSLILIYSCDLLMDIGLAAAWSTGLVPTPLSRVATIKSVVCI